MSLTQKNQLLKKINFKSNVFFPQKSTLLLIDKTVKILFIIFRSKRAYVYA